MTSVDYALDKVAEHLDRSISFERPSSTASIPTDVPSGLTVHELAVESDI